MAAASTDDKARMRYPYHRIVRPVLNVFPVLDLDEVVGTATVGSLAGLTYPIADIPVTGASVGWGSIARGTYVRITDGSGNFVMDTIWRKFADGTTTYLYSLGFSRGDSGIAVEQAIALAEGQTITCYRVRIPKVYPSRIDTGVLYKRWDLAFSSVEPSAQANLGKHRQADIDPDTGLARLTLSAETTGRESYSWVGGTLTYNWNEPTGATLVAGYASTDATIEMDYVPGAYLQRCTVSDSVSGTQEASFRYIFVNGDDGLGNAYTAFSDEFNVSPPLTDVEDLKSGGRVMTFQASGTNIKDYLVTGAPALFTYTQEHSADGVTWEEFDDDIEPNNFFGYVFSFNVISRDENGVETVQFSVVSPLIMGEKFRFATQYLIESASPDEWWKLPDTLCHAAFVPYYVMDLHSRWMTEINDYLYGDGDLYFKFQWDIDADNMADACRKAAQPFLGNFGCDSDGTFLLRRNPQYETDANRDANPVVMAITDADMYPPVQYQRNELMTGGDCQGGAYIYTGEGDDAKIYGKLYRTNLGAAGQGVQTFNMPDFIALSTTEAASRVGHYRQRLNAPTPTISFEMPGSHDAFHLASMEWWEMDVASYDPMARGLWSNRILPIQVTRNWQMDEESGSLTKTLSIVAEPETYGQPATNKVRQRWNGQGVAPSVSWCYDWDTAALLANWTQVFGTSDAGGFYSTGVGNDQVQIYYDVGASFSITSVEFTFNSVWGGTSPRIAIAVTGGGTIVSSTTSSGSTTIILTANYTSTDGRITFDLDRYVGNLQAWSTLRLTGITLRGNGGNPFGVSNC